MEKFTSLLNNKNRNKKSVKIQGIEFLVRELYAAEHYAISVDNCHIITERGNFKMVTSGYKRILLEGGRLELIFLPERNLFRSDIS